MVLRNLHECVFERRRTGQDVDQPGARRQPEALVEAWLTEIRVDHQHPALKLLRHRQRQVQRGDRLAVVFSGARNLNHANRLTILGLADARAKRSVLFGGGRMRIQRGHEQRAEHGVERGPAIDGERSRVGNDVFLDVLHTRCRDFLHRRQRPRVNRGSGVAKGEGRRIRYGVVNCRIATLYAMRRAVPSRSAFARIC